MNKKFKFLTVLLALVMTLGAFAPFSAVKAADEEGKKEETTNTVTVHKILLSKAQLGDHNIDKEYDGKKITDLKSFFAEKWKDGDHVPTEIAGVYFAFKYNDGTNSGKYVTIKEEAGKDPVYGAVEKLDATLENGYKLLAGETLANGIKFTTKGLKGNFLIEEIHDKSTYKGTQELKDKDGKVVKDKEGNTIYVNTQLTDMKAVPVKITLPLVNNDGVVPDAHVYPKNTEDIPKIDKNFAKDNKLTSVIDPKSNKDVGAEYANYEEKKATVTAEIGKEIPYEVKTEIPAKSKLAEAHWDDKMTEGLTYNKDLKVTIGGTEITPSTDELVQTDNGFSLRLKGDNLALLNNKDAAVTVVLTYTAKINNTTVTDVPESNDVTFHYGNTPGKGNTPVPNKPSNKELTVVKTWADGITDAEKIEVSVQLYNANTGEKVGEVQKLNEGNKWTYKWTNLDDKYQYKVVEIYSGFEAEYGVDGVGKITIKNHKSDNPKPLNPTEPKVITGGKRFVKTNQDGTERLAGAEFVVKNNDGKYLALKSGKTVAAEVTAYETAEANYNKFIKAYNEIVAKAKADKKEVTYPITIDGASYANKDAVDAKLKELKDTRDTKFLASRENYQWITAKDGDAAKEAGALVLTSDDQGRFEVTGLAYGDYQLVEIKAPDGYAKLTGNEEFLKFKVEKGSYNGQPEGVKHKHIGYDSDTDKIKGQQITNKKVSIPQTGGIGTVIFTVVGVMLMVGAAFALKRRKEDELEGLA